MMTVASRLKSRDAASGPGLWSEALAKPGPLTTLPGWSYEVKWDGFRALVSTVDGLKVRSRRGWKRRAA